MNSDLIPPFLRRYARRTLFAIAALILLSLVYVKWPISLPPDTSAVNAPKERREIEEHRTKILSFYLSILGGLGAAAAFTFGLLQYDRAERWKRTEFLAQQMKDFFSDPEVRTVLTMIDWAPRRLNLHPADAPVSRRVVTVSRELQISALLPHEALMEGSEGTSSPDGEEATANNERPGQRKTHFTLDEARIRDLYDHFLDHLERLGSYRASGLVRKEELDPHLRYWITDIAAATNVVADAAWTCALIRYIEKYDYQHVKDLFQAYEVDLTRFAVEKQDAAVKQKIADALVWPNPTA